MADNENNNPKDKSYAASYPEANEEKKLKLGKLSRSILEKLKAAAQRTEAPEKLLVHRELRIYPSADVMFSFIASDKVIFAELMGSIIEEEIDTEELEVESQVTMIAAEDFDKAKKIRLDVRGTNKKMLMATEMQNDPRKALADDRSPYYHAVLLASQIVEGMHYDRLKTVCVTFIMPTKELKDSSGIRQLEWADVKTGQFVENSDRRYFLYVPNILKNENIRIQNPTLYMFARFYEIFTQEQADAFLRDYRDEPIARRMIHMSNVLNEERTNIQEMYTIPYYDRKVLVEEIARLEQEALQSRQENAAILELLKSESPELYKKITSKIDNA